MIFNWLLIAGLPIDPAPAVPAARAAATACRAKWASRANDQRKGPYYRTLLDQVDDMEAALSELEDAASKAEQQEEDARAAAAAAASASSGPSSSGASSGASSSDTWYVSYIWGGQAEIDTGAVVQWKSGYFCAHNWSSGGVMIASKPSYVVVDGVTYRYVSSINVARDTTWGEVSGFALANGGIAFQTCSGDTYLITHYEPV